MKKVTLLLLLVLVASSLLMAAAPLRLVRLYTINKSYHTIYMKLEGTATDSFYYLTIPYGTKLNPDYSEFTLVQDVYSRTTWYGPGDLGCEGLKSTGELWVVKQMKLTFTACGHPNIRGWLIIGNLRFPIYNYGEPTWGEKVSYFKWIEAWGVNVTGWGCFWGVATRSYKSPLGSCYFLYKY